MFALPSVIIAQGLARLADLVDRSAYTDDENQIWDAYESLLETPQSMAIWMRQWHQGGFFPSVKSIDTKGVKDGIPEWHLQLYPDSPGIPQRQSAHGYYSLVTGRHICPAVLNYNNSAVQAALRAGQATIDGSPGEQVGLYSRSRLSHLADFGDLVH
ncbi:hypothetical protein DXG01_015414 [Tephrocybe rancida]|nr:hypothetical protein DXG01_015414 [Tephrocybe rancida]